MKLSKFIRISSVEAKYVIRNKGFLFGLFLAFVYLIGIMSFWGDAKSFLDGVTFKVAYPFFSDITYYIVITIAATSLSKEFAFKTSRVVFTSGLSRYQVLLVKMSSLLMVSVFIAILHQTVVNIMALLAGDQRDTVSILTNLGTSILVYSLFALFVGSVSFFLTSLLFSRLWTLIIVIFAFIMERQIRAIIMLVGGEKYTDFLNQTPMAIATESFLYNSLSLSKSLILLISSAILLLLTTYILNKREIR